MLVVQYSGRNDYAADQLKARAVIAEELRATPDVLWQLGNELANHGES